MKIKIQKLPNFKGTFPSYETLGSAGMDIHAAIGDSIKLHAGDRVLIPSGFKVEIPKGFEIQIRPRSGLAFKNGITVLNSPGTIDSDYRGEVGVIIINHGSQIFFINPGDRIAQMIVSQLIQAELEEIDSLSITERGEGGFGSTGVKND